MEKFIHAFNLVSGGGYIFLEKIRRYFGDFQRAWEKGRRDDFLKAGFSPDLVAKIEEARHRIDVGAEMDRLWRADIFAVTKDSSEYPTLLKRIEAAPFLLYRKGATLQPDGLYTAVVGTRNPSQYGEKLALEIAEGIAVNGGIVVSGLAYGIDAIAHYGAVKKNKPTVAVLASSVDNITPSGNSGLAKKFLETGGSIVSEYASQPGGESASWKYRFLERNRIISGLCKATIVIEAKSRSGALITADHALKQDRDIYALVGDLTRPQTQGCLNLIERGEALPITSVRGLLGDLGFDTEAQKMIGLEEEDILILNGLRTKPLTADEICRALNVRPDNLNGRLTKLEMKNLIRTNLLRQWETVKPPR